MPSMTEHESNSIVKAICAADSGSGKTGALASLVDAGFKVRVLDFDNGLSVLKGYVKDKSKLANVHFVDRLQDDLKLLGGRIGITKAPAFQRAMDALDKGGQAYWGSAEIGPLSTWGPDTVLVVDSYSMAGRVCLQMVMFANGKGLSNPEIQHYGLAMDNLEKWVGMLTSSETKCHVILNTHITGIEGSPKLYPEALGSKLGPKLGRYFDNMVGLSVSAGKRQFKTERDGLLALKTATKLPETLPIETGWVDIFKAITGKQTAEIISGK